MSWAWKWLELPTSPRPANRVRDLPPRLTSLTYLAVRTTPVSNPARRPANACLAHAGSWPGLCNCPTRPSLLLSCCSRACFETRIPAPNACRESTSSVVDLQRPIGLCAARGAHHHEERLTTPHLHTSPTPHLHPPHISISHPVTHSTTPPPPPSHINSPPPNPGSPSTSPSPVIRAALIDRGILAAAPKTVLCFCTCGS